MKAQESLEFPTGSANRKRVLSLIVLPLLFAPLTASFAQTWTGRGKSASWNDPGNWSILEAPSPGIGAEFVFDSAAGNRFGFGGTSAFRAASMTFTENAGRYSFSAPEIVFGGSAAEDLSDGYVLENLFSAGAIVNASTNTQSFNTDVRLGWDAEIKTANGNIAITGNLTGPEYAITKTGEKDMILFSGTVEIGGLELNEGGVTLVGSEAKINDIRGKNEETGLNLLNGARLVSGKTGEDKSVALYAQVSMSGVDKETGRPCVWNLSQNRLWNYGRPFTLSHGASITNAGWIALMQTRGVTNGIEYALSDGASIYCRGLSIGCTDESSYRAASNMTFSVMGAPSAAKRQTTLDAGGQRINVGYAFDGKAVVRYNSLTVADNAKVTNADMLAVPGGGGNFNTAAIKDGALLSCIGISVGYLGDSNRVEISGAGTKALLNTGIIRVGSYDGDSSPCGNGLTIRDGAQVVDGDTIIIANSSGYAKGNDTGNFLVLKSGAKLVSKSTIVSNVGAKDGTSSKNYMLVEGKGTSWNASNENIGVGYAEAGTSTENFIGITDGATVTNVSSVIVGAGKGNKSFKNRMIVANGARLFSSGSVHVGLNSNPGKSSTAEDNIVQVAGGELGGTVWNLGGGNLLIGSAGAWSAASKNNKFVLLPGAAVVNVGVLAIGRGEGDFKGNALVLAGGIITANSLAISELNGIDVVLQAAGIKPILIETDVKFDYDTFITPQAAAGAKSGRYPLLGWKGKATNLDKIKLAKGADKKRWTLEILEDQKKIYLNYDAK